MGSPKSARVALYSILLNLTIMLGKGFLAFLSGSTALIAETIHSASDLVASFATFIGIRISHLKGKAFPFGLYKVENFVALISAGFIFFGGYEIAKESFFCSSAVKLKNLPLAFAGLTLIAIIIYLFSNYESRKGEELNSPGLKADSRHLYSDLASIIVVLLGLLGAWLGYSNLDRVAAIIVVIFIARAGWRILLDAMKSLLDASVETTTLDIIRNVVEADPRVKGIRSIIARNSGSVIFINLVITLNLKGLKEAHEASEQIAASVRKAVPHAEKVQIHYEPDIKEYILAAIPLSTPDGRISDHFGSAPYIALVKLKKNSHQAFEHDILPNPYSTDEKAKGIHLSQLLIQKGVDIIYTRESLEGKGPAILIERANVDVEIIDHKYLPSFLKNIALQQNSGLANP
ncbi:MAG: cation diffusion facilitator family transporter [Peptococcaceae bacterium]|nr:cation diffusion facilitator family transporter [Peptococcaceae bacterium]